MVESATADTTILTTKRTTTFLASLLVALCCGTNYVYSAYGPQLGSRLKLSFAEQNLVGLSGNFGMYASGPFIGKLADSTGPRPSLALSFLLLLSGYLGIRTIYDASKGRTDPVGTETFFALILFESFIGIGSDAGYCAVLNTVMRSFPDKIITTAIGLIISSFALSAFVFSTIEHTFFPGDTSKFLLILAVGSASPMVLGWFLVRPCPYPEHIERANTEGGDREEPDNPGIIPNETSPLILGNDPKRPPGVGSLAMIRTIDFWILFCIMSILNGTGIMWINNIGLMARVLTLKNNPGHGDQEKWQTLQVLTMSIASCTGRILIGVTADFAKHRGMRRAQFISIIAASFLVSQLVGIRIREVEYLQYAVFLVGISYGATIGLLPIIVVEWFGMAHVSENAGFFSMSPLVMGNIFSIAFGRIFDTHASQGKHGMHCLEGARCYSASLYVTALGCFCALILGFVAAKRDRKYR